MTIMIYIIEIFTMKNLIFFSQNLISFSPNLFNNLFIAYKDKKGKSYEI